MRSVAALTPRRSAITLPRTTGGAACWMRVTVVVEKMAATKPHEIAPR